MVAASQDSARTWFPALEGMRGLAATAIVVYHLRLPGTFGAGQGAMEIFFVLSGFLITSILVDEYDERGSIRLLRFYGRRMRRLFPALLCLVLAVAILSLVASPPLTPGGPVAALLYVMNIWEILVGAREGVLDQTWSLAIEEQYYLLWPVVLLVVLRARDPRRRLVIVAGLVVAALAVRGLVVLSEPPLLRIRNGTDVRAFAFLLGGLVAVVRPFDVLPRLRSAGAILAALALAVIPPAVQEYTGRTFLTWWLLAPIATAVVIWQVSRPDAGRVGRILSVAPLRWLGMISYSLYLWHPVVIWIVGLWFGGPVGTRRPVYLELAFLATSLTAAMLVALVSYRLVERTFWRPRGVRRVMAVSITPDASQPVRA
jgi:peptidoglycan/LPS O-acetylase OafA/YrhL